MSAPWLVIESSGKVGQLGLVHDGAILSSRRLEETRRLARDLAPSVGLMLDEQGLKPKDIAGVMVSIGPGSYTGLRVGITSAKTFAYAVACPLIAVPTFEAIALQAPGEAPDVWVIADALQGLVYVQRFRENCDGLRIVPASELRTAPSEAWFTGPGVMIHNATFPSPAKIVDESLREPTLESIYRAGLSHKPLTREELFALEPLYLRGSSAEEKAKSNEPRG